MNLEEKTKIYQSLFRKYGHNSKSLRWHSQKGVQIHYQQLLTDLSLKNKSILDLGCGFGDIIPFLEQKTDKFHYTGWDIVPEFVHEAKKLHPKQSFFIHDFVRVPIKRKFNIVIACGSLNSNLSKNLDFRKKIIKKMLESADYAISFNMAGSYPQPTNHEKKSVWYANSKEILEFCFTLSRKIMFKHHYLPKEFTITIFK